MGQDTLINKRNKNLRLLGFLILAAVFSAILGILIFGVKLQGKVAIDYRDTYFVTTPMAIILFIFLAAIVLMTSVKLLEKFWKRTDDS